MNKHQNVQNEKMQQSNNQNNIIKIFDSSNNADNLYNLKNQFSPGFAQHNLNQGAFINGQKHFDANEQIRLS